MREFTVVLCGRRQREKIACTFALVEKDMYKVSSTVGDARYECLSSFEPTCSEHLQKMIEYVNGTDDLSIILSVHDYVALRIRVPFTDVKLELDLKRKHGLAEDLWRLQRSVEEKLDALCRRIEQLEAAAATASGAREDNLLG